jgi:hypothetical protein
MQYLPSKPVSLKAHPSFSEKWLQKTISDDPSLLGLGELVVRDAERIQPHAGRLDLLLVDPESATRYEVEIQLGPTDPSHIIRTIEYWDIEKNRYPQYDHVAVLVAEDITSRFLNVIGLLHRAVPLIAIQLRALDVGGNLTLSATKVLDVFTLGTEEEDEPGQPTDRAYWIRQGSDPTLALTDELLRLVNEVTPGTELKYNKYYIGLVRDGLVDNYVQFTPKKQHVIAEVRLPRSDEVSALMEDGGLDVMGYDKQWNRYKIRITPGDPSIRRDVLLELMHRAAGVERVEAEPA